MNFIKTLFLHVLMAYVVPESSHQNTDLKTPTCNQVGEANSCPTGILKERHQEAKAYEHHHVDIHVHRIASYHHIDSSLLILS
jgi:hypothetical protein